LEGPATSITFLGIEIDSVKQELRLPSPKFLRLRQLISQWNFKRACTKRQLQSFIGHLSHAAMVVRPGRTFLRRMLDLLRAVKRPSHFIRLNRHFFSDLRWWELFLPRWNRRSILTHHHMNIKVTSDASGNWGCGAFAGKTWFQLQWPADWSAIHIAAKEMVPIVIAMAIWGQQWQGCHVQCLSDNVAVVAAVNKGSARDPLLMHLLRALFFILAHYDICLTAEHIPGRHNCIADSLSRNNSNLFFNLLPQASRQPTQVLNLVFKIL